MGLAKLCEILSKLFRLRLADQLLWMTINEGLLATYSNLGELDKMPEPIN